MEKVKVRFVVDDFEEELEYDLDENWLHDVYGEGWEILDEYEK